jgi:hypothetical protein
VAAEGAVYETWDPDRHVVELGQVPIIEQVLMAGLDYGTTHPTRAYLLGLGQHPSRGWCLYVLSEFAPGKGTVSQHATAFNAWLAGQPHESWRTPKWKAVDPAAAVFRQELFDAGAKNVMRAHNAVLPGIQVVDSLLGTGHLLVVGSQCPELLKRLPGYRWDETASKRGETKPLKVDDDEVDALRYTVYSSRQQWRRYIPLAAAESGANEEAEDVR